MVHAVRSARIAAGLSFVFTAGLVAQRSSWPHWRGPARDGISSESEWTSVGRSVPLWSAELGRGYSNVSIEDGRLFTLGFDEDAGVDRLYCLDCATGEERWRKEWLADIRANFHGGGTLTTPTIDGDVLFVTNREGRAMALEVASGAELWHRNYADELGLKVTFHGFSASPLALDDRLILVLGGTAMSVAKKTGDIVWRTKDHGDGGYSNPVPFELDGRRLVCAYFGGGPVVLDIATGEEVCRYPWRPKAGGVNCATPIVFGRKLFITSAYDQGAALLEFSADGRELRQLWRNRRMRNKVSGCVLWEGHIYGFDESMLKCIDLEGRDKWRVRGLGMGSVALADGRLIVVTSKGELIVAAASPDGFREQSRQKVLSGHGAVYWTNPVLLDGRIYVRNSLGSLVCLDHRPRHEVADTVTPGEGSAVALPDAADLFDAHARLVGGERLRARRSLHIEGTIEVAAEGITERPMSMDISAPDKWRLRYELDRYGRFERGSDGRVAWVISPFEGESVLEGDALREALAAHHLHAPVEWRTLHPTVKTTGREVFAGRPCWVVAAQSRDGATRRFYFELSTRRLAGYDGTGESLVTLADWRRFDGVELPTRTTIAVSDTGGEEVRVIRSVKWDAVEDVAHALPDSIRRLLRTPEEIEAANVAARREFAVYLGTYDGEVRGRSEAWDIVIADGDLAIERAEASPVGYVRDGAGHRFVPRRARGRSIEFRLDARGAVEGFVFRAGRMTVEFARQR